MSASVDEAAVRVADDLGHPDLWPRSSDQHGALAQEYAIEDNDVRANGERV